MAVLKEGQEIVTERQPINSLNLNPSYKVNLRIVESVVTHKTSTGKDTTIVYLKGYKKPLVLSPRGILSNDSLRLKIIEF